VNVHWRITIIWRDSDAHSLSGDSERARFDSERAHLLNSISAASDSYGCANGVRIARSKRMSTGRDGIGPQALSHELEHGVDLLARHVELLHDFIDTEVLEVLDDRRNGQTGALEHPGAAHLAGNAFAAAQFIDFSRS